MNRRRSILLSAILLAAALVAAAFFMRPGPRPFLGRGPLPLSASPFLADVVEPIRIVETFSFDDGGSCSVRYRDARGVERDFCLVSFALDFDDPPRQSELAFDTWAPSRDTVAIGSDDERVLLGLLERWSASDPEGHVLDERLDAFTSGQDDLTGLSDDARSRLIVRSILRRLRDRN